MVIIFKVMGNSLRIVLGFMVITWCIYVMYNYKESRVHAESVETDLQYHGVIHGRP